MSGRFETTQWSQVIRARDGEEADAQQALEALCETYWYPLYAYVRRRGADPDAARDLTQAFFADLLSRDFLDHIDPAKGKFRTFLLTSMSNFLSNEWQKGRAQKRGGGAPTLSLDIDTAEQRFRREPTENVTPEDIYERRWAVTVMQQAMERLRRESPDRSQFEALRPFLTGSEQMLPYRQAAADLGMTESALKTAVHRLRRRYGGCLRSEIAQTVTDESEIDDEVRHLLRVSGA